MCLDKLQNFKIKSNIGYKEFSQKDDGHLDFENFGNKKRIPIGKWINEKDYRTREDRFIKKVFAGKGDGQYELGFHFFLRQDTYGNRRKIKFRGILAKGYQYGERVIVAKEIYIFPIKTKKRSIKL